MFATAKRVDATEAYEISLVSRIADPVIDCAVEIALEQAAKAEATS
jgi:hypothetical protein